jgi:hypothetical protein
MLALGSLLMIGMVLIAEGFGAHVPKGYIYAAMAFSALIESLNMLSRRARKPRWQRKQPDAPAEVIPALIVKRLNLVPEPPQPLSKGSE